MIVGVLMLIAVGLSASTGLCADDVRRCAFDGYYIWDNHGVSQDYHAKTYHFCTKYCRDLFLKDPSRYIGKIAPEPQPVSGQQRQVIIDKELDRFSSQQSAKSDPPVSQEDVYEVVEYVSTKPQLEIPQPVDQGFSKTAEDERLAAQENLGTGFADQIILTSSDGSYEKAMRAYGVDVGVEYHDYSYREPSLGVKDDGSHAAAEVIATKRGVMYGQRQDENTVRSTMNYVVSLGVRVFDGQVDYEGSGTFDGLDDHGFELRLLAGAEWLYQNYLFNPYLGFGWRKLYNEFAEVPARILDGTPYASGYDRDSRYFYLPVGLTVTRYFPKGWSLAATAEYDHLLKGEQVSHLDKSVDIGGANAGYSKAVNIQDDGFGLRFALRLAKDVGLMNMYVEPFFRYWKIRDSNQVLIYDLGGGFGIFGMEPENNTKELGIKMGVDF